MLQFAVEGGGADPELRCGLRPIAANGSQDSADVIAFNFCEWFHTRAVFSAKGSISRKDFGLTWNQALETGGVMVGDLVEIEIDIEAVKQSDTKVA